MTTDYRFILQPYRGPGTRHTCPGCGVKRSFTLYVDSETGEPIHEAVGICNRVNSCGYHVTPRDFFRDHQITIDRRFTPRPIEPPKPPSYIPFDIFKDSLRNYESNNLITYLNKLVGPGLTHEATQRYYIGTSKFWPGATVWYQIDYTGRIRAGKIMLYDAVRGKRVKNPFNHIAWVHKLLQQPDYNLRQCLFGEHLLKDSNKPIAVVESEKTAVIASIYLQKFTWIATGGLGNISTAALQPLAGRNVTLFPDLMGFQRWKKVANEMGFGVSELLENNATEEEKNQGLDIADYLTRFDIKEFSENNKNKTEL